MGMLPAFGLRARIAFTLAAVFAAFIVLTEATVSQLVRLAIARADGAAQAALAQDLVHLHRLILFYLTLGALGALVLGVFAVTRLVVRPLERLGEAVDRVAAGRRDIAAPLAGSRELIDLGIAFNRMTATISAQEEELRSRLAAIERSATELKETQDKLVRAAKLASVGTLAAGVAHEIGNPLAGILGLLDATEAGADAETRARYLALMRKEIQRIDRTISDLLVYARPRRADGAPAESAVEEVLEHVRSLLGAQRLFDNVALEVDAPGGPFRVAMVRDDLTQVLINLLLNAAQAMAGRGRITVSVRPLSDWRPRLGVVVRPALRIEVKDDGPGVPEEDRERIFDPFFSRKQAGDGSGLGLAVCQSLCERAGGEIALDRGDAPGSRFAITLLRAEERAVSRS